MEDSAPRLLLITSEWPPSRTLKRAAEPLHATGLSVEIFAYRGRTFFDYIAAWTRLRPRLHRGRYDLVHAQHVANVLLALPKRVPLVVTVDARDARRLRQMLSLFLARRADAVIVTSAELRVRVRTRAPVHVVTPDLDASTLAARLVEVYRTVIPESFSRS